MMPSESPIELESVTEVTPHNKALYEAGKAMLVESIAVGREFCRFMTTTTLSAIPVYLGLIKLVLPKGTAISIATGKWLVPPSLFLTAAIVFALGYFPGKANISLDLIEDIRKERDRTIKRRWFFAVGGFTLLCIGVARGAWLVLEMMSILRPGP